MSRARHPVLLGLLSLLGLVMILALLVLAGGGRFLGWRPRSLDPQAAARRYALALPALPATLEWINGAPVAADSLRGHAVILAVFSGTDPRERDWLPAVEEWHQAYAPLGVRVIGLQRAQFAFARDSSFTRRFARRLGLSFPIAVDTDFKVILGRGRTSAQLLMADAEGRVRLSARAPGARERTVLDPLFREFAFGGSGLDSSLMAGGGPHSRGDLQVVSLGANQPERGPLASVVLDAPQQFVTQTRWEEEGQRDVPVPVGRWTPRRDGITAVRGGAANFLAIRYDATRVGLVASPPAGSRVRVYLLRDEEWIPAAARGADVIADASGATYIDVDEARLYEIIGGAGSHVLKASPAMPGVTLHAVMLDDPDADAASR